MAIKKAKYRRKNAQGQYDIFHFETETAQVLGLADFVKSLGYVHPNSGVGAGTYKSVTVNAQGHVTAGTNPTTLAGYGITDAVGASDSRLTNARPANGGNADTVDGKHANDAAGQIALKSADNDINCRLLKQTYADQATISGGLVFRTNATTDNYLRVCNDVAAIKTFLGLGNVNNTADSAKPISAAMQAALNTKAPVFAKNTAFNKNFGTTAGTVCQGNDARLSDARKSPGALIISLNGANQGAYDGSAAKAINITAANIGATAATMGGIIAGSLAQNGWVKFANGLILQWGSAETLAGSSWAYAYAKFPIAFPTTNYNILATHVGTDTVNVAEKIDEHGTTQTTLLAKNNVGTNLAGWILRWFAIGF